MDSKYCSESPQKLVTEATHFIQNLQKSSDLPQSESKRNYFFKLAALRRNEVLMKIQQNIKLNNNFRKLQKIDGENRNNLFQQISEKTLKINNLKKLKLKQKSDYYHNSNQNVYKKLNKHLQDNQIFEKECEKEFHKLTQQQKSFILDKNLKEKNQWERLQRLKTSYPQAIDIITNREHKKQMFSLKTEQQLSNKLLKNTKKLNPELESIKKLRKKHYALAYKKSEKYYSGRYDHFLQKYCSDIDLANKMQKFKKKVSTQTSQKIHDFLEKRSSLWLRNKKMIDEQDEIIAPKCLSKLEKINSTFLSTQISSQFHEVSRTWVSKNRLKKNQLYEIKTKKDDKLINQHLDTSKLNKSKVKLNNLMLDLKLKAGFNSKQFL